jgi:hypothetical protein
MHHQGLAQDTLLVAILKTAEAGIVSERMVTGIGETNEAKRAMTMSLGFLARVLHRFW